MTEQEVLNAVVAELRAESKHNRDYLRASTVCVAMLPILYSLLTFWFSNALWDPNGVHAAAMKVPGAPESWGVLFLALGIGTIAFSELDWRWSTVIITVLASFTLASFMFSFLLSGDYPNAFAPAVPYGLFAVLFLNRARRAWVG